MENTSEQSLIIAYESFVRLVMSDGPIDQLDDLATVDAMGYGTTIDEVIHNLTELKNLARLQREQTAHGNFHYNSTPVFRKVMNHGNTAVFVDELQLNFVFDGMPMSFQIRLSVIMEFVDDKWKAVHFHASKPEYDSGGSDPWHKEEWKQKNEELQRMVDEKTADLAEKNRELEMEAALERVRTVAMSMHKPDDLLDVCQIISEQLEMLNVNNIRNVQVAIINESKKSYSNYQFFAAYAKRAFEETGYENNPASKSMVQEMQKSANSFFIGSIKGEELEKFNAWRKEYGQFPDPIMDDMTEVFYYFYSIGEGGLGLTTYKAIDDKELDIFKRFHLVFKLAYRRFMDIQKAGAQAREAQIELALERVRSRTMAMQKSEELKEVIQLVYEQFAHLDIFIEHTGFIMDYKLQDDMHIWLADKNGVPSRVTVPYFDSSHWNSFNEAKAKGFDFFANHLTFEEKNKFYHELFKLIPGVPEETSKYYFSCPGLAISTVLLENVGLYIENFSGIPYSDEENNTLMRFGKVFQQTYTRFLDLQKVEAQALRAEKDLIAIKAARQKAEEALLELKATQSQLIQSEKMASLGELTAGIAHEIQNPLNFVNNFSEVNSELIDELEHEVDKGNLDEVKALAKDIKENELKINHHGKRADAIVKGMLQHSRSSNGAKEPTDINALADEYLRLAYHGLRAKDKSFNATLKTDFDESIGKIDIIPQDIGRVILNLINNAFYAVNEKKKLAGTDYQPTVSIRTSKTNNRVELLVSDNGNGIPPSIVEKIFQPFFTTKPTGEGTGLGLSLSYDIVRTHGGELKVESDVDSATGTPSFTNFTITLPQATKY